MQLMPSTTVPLLVLPGTATHALEAAAGSLPFTIEVMNRLQDSWMLLNARGKMVHAQKKLEEAVTTYRTLAMQLERLHHALHAENQELARTMAVLQPPHALDSGSSSSSSSSSSIPQPQPLTTPSLPRTFRVSRLQEQVGQADLHQVRQETRRLEDEYEEQSRFAVAALSSMQERLRLLSATNDEMKHALRQQL